MFRFNLILTGWVLIIAAHASAQQSPQNPLAQPVPAPISPGAAAMPNPPGQAAASGAPDWIRPGTRITFYAASATIPGSYNQLVQDPDGRWVDPTTGKTFSSVDNPSASGQGYTQVNIVDLQRDLAASEFRSFGLDAGSGAITSYGASGFAGPPSSGSDFWVHPTALKQMGEQNTPGLTILRMPYPLGGKTYNALRIQSKNDRGFSQHTYDLDSGVLLIAGTSTAGSNVAVLGAGGQVQSGAGYTTLTQTRFLTMRELKLPWNGMPAPEWVANTRVMNFTGTQTISVAGAGGTSFPLIIRFTFKRAGPGWAEVTQFSEVRNNLGVPPQQTQSDRVYGTSMASGLWIPPQALAQLRPGQVLDEDPFTKSRYSVTQVGNGRANLIEAGPSETLESSYEMRTGMLVAALLTQRNGLGTTQWSVTLQGRQ